MIRTVILIALMLIGTYSAAQAPIPFCNSQNVYRQGPLSPGQKVIFDIADAFTGYNLDVKIATNTTTARVIEKFQELDKKRISIPGLITHHIQSIGNQWGKQSFLLERDFSGSINFAHGLFKSDNSSDLPVFDYTILISNEKFVDCFGAGLFYDYGLAIVDCIHTSFDGKISNYFYYLDLVTHTVSRKVETPMFVPFKSITRRQIIRFKDHQTGYTYLLRAYQAAGVNADHRDNTYMEIFSAKDPNDLQLVRVIDRTMLHINTLSIVDIEVYNGDIFFLDYLHGLFRLDILVNQDFIITGRYRKDGFYKFAVYSDDLDDQLIIALANSHAVYQINWGDTLAPVELNKYSLMEHSHIRQLYMNDRFLIVQSSSNATNSTVQNFEMDYTWIFNKGARTYMNAYHVVNHNTSKVQLDLSNNNDRVIIADGDGITLYQLSNQQTTLYLEDQTKVGTSEDIVFIATSTDPLSQKTFSCQQKLTIQFVNSTDQRVWPTNYDRTTLYSTNYPGQLHIDLRNYATGANLTYDLVNKSSTSKSQPIYWVDKINDTKINYNGEVGDIIFFHTQVVPNIGEYRILYYIQNSQYKTIVAECKHIVQSNTINCQQQAKYDHTSKIVAFTTAYFIDTEIGFNYYYIMVFQEDLKLIRAYDFLRHRSLFNITYSGHQQAQVTSIASSNGYLYVLRSAIKTIDVYRLSVCGEKGSCTADFSINADLMKGLGVDYFAPKKLITDQSHPEVLFIKCLGSILIIDVDNKEKVTKLEEIRSTGAQNLHSEIAVNQGRMMIVSEPDRIQIFSLEHIYTKREGIFLKTLPIYNYQIPVGADIQFSDVDALVYVNAKDPATNHSVILIYNTYEPAASGLYGVIELPSYYSRPALEIQVSGFIVDYLSIKTPQGFQVFRVFELPFLAIKDTVADFNFSISAANTADKLTSEQIKIATVNNPSGFTPTAQLNSTIENLKLQQAGNYTWDDRLWFQGHVTGYNFSCDECDNPANGTPGKVRVREHVQTMRSLPIYANDYVETIDGGVSISQDLFKFHVNGSIHEIFLIPDQNSHEYCQRVATIVGSPMIISACDDQTRGINLYVTSRSSFKAWTYGPFQTPAKYVRNLHIAGNILILTDTFSVPQTRFYKGSIFLYSLGFDMYSSEQLDELEIIDQNDLLIAHGFDKKEAILCNSYLTYAPFTQNYRLYITELDSGLFVVDFKYQLGRQQINIIQVQFVDIKALLQKNNLHMPTDASFFAVTLASYKYNPIFDTQSMLVTTNKYHNFEILIVYDDSGHIVSSLLHRVHYRYGFYQATNDIRSSYGYMAVPYVLPSIYRVSTNFTKQILAVYDTSDYPHQTDKGYSERYMLGGFRFDRSTDIVFGFNHTFDIHSNGTRIGLVVTSHYTDSRRMFEVSLSKNLTSHLDRDFSNQDLTFIPYNDFKTYSFKIQLYNYQQQQQFILAIIITILIAVTTIAFVIYLVVLIRRRKRQNIQNNEQRVSLLTEEESMRQTITPNDQQYISPKDNENQDEGEDADEEGQDEEQGQENQEKDQAEEGQKDEEAGQQEDNQVEEKQNSKQEEGENGDGDEDEDEEDKNKQDKAEKQPEQKAVQSQVQVLEDEDKKQEDQPK